METTRMKAAKAVSPEFVVKNRRRAKARPNHHQVMALESVGKIWMNLALASVAAIALLQNLPRQQQNYAKLQEIRAEVAKTEARVGQVQQDFARYFDPATIPEVMQEQSHLLRPNQRQIVVQPASKLAQ